MFRNYKFFALAPAALAFSLGAQLHAQDNDYEAQSPEIVERGADGRAQIVRVDGKEYQVCVGERDDNCIQPRAAGLRWGDRPLRYWPSDRDETSDADQNTTKDDAA